MTPCLLCKDTGRQQVRQLYFDTKYEDRPCLCARPPAPEEVLDGLAFRAMTQDQLVERIALDFGATWQSANPTLDRVVLYIGRLVAAYGPKLGGLSRKRLAARVMRRIEAHQRKKAKEDWDKYYGRA